MIKDQLLLQNCINALKNFLRPINFQTFEIRSRDLLKHLFAAQKKTKQKKFIFMFCFH